MRRMRGLLGPLMACLALVLAARLVLDLVMVRGRSMAPTLLPGDRLVAIRLGRAPRPGEIVLAPDPRQPSRELVKRVSKVERAGVTLRGDSPAFSTDARVFGAIPVTDVRWRIVARYWPLHRAGPVPPVAQRDRLDEGGESACAVPGSLIAG